MKTMKVKPWGEGQGDFVLINESDFDPKLHKPLAGAIPEPKQDTTPQQKATKGAK